MTLDQLKTFTAGMPGSTPIHVLSPWGDIEPAAIVTVEDFVPGDPVRDDIPPDSIVIAADADLANRTTLDPTEP